MFTIVTDIDTTVKCILHTEDTFTVLYHLRNVILYRTVSLVFDCVRLSIIVVIRQYL